jgi:hypothetical protein
MTDHVSTYGYRKLINLAPVVFDHPAKAEVSEYQAQNHWTRDPQTHLLNLDQIGRTRVSKPA